MAFHRRIDREPIGTSGGTEELRPTRSSTELATATMACPECDAPVMPSGPVRPTNPLEDPARPARVIVRVVLR